MSNTSAKSRRSWPEPGTDSCAPAPHALFPLPGGGALLFERPLGVLVGRCIADVRPVLAEVDAAVAAGYWVAGMLAYEAAPGLDRALVTCPPGPLPLVWFALFAAPRRLPLGSPPVALAAAIPGEAWVPSLDATAHGERVDRVRDAIARGDTYQVNLT